MAILSQRDSIGNKNFAFNTSMNDQSMEQDQSFSPGFESKLGQQDASQYDGGNLNQQQKRSKRAANFAQSEHQSFFMKAIDDE